MSHLSFIIVEGSEESMITVAEIKNNLRIDYDEDDTYLEMLLGAAQLYILGSIEVTVLPDDPKTSTLIFMLVSLWYENRVPATNAMQQQVPFTITAMIHQLRGLNHGEYQDIQAEPADYTTSENALTK